MDQGAWLIYLVSGALYRPIGRIFLLHAPLARLLLVTDQIVRAILKDDPVVPHRGMASISWTLRVVRVIVTQYRYHT